MKDRRSSLAILLAGIAMAALITGGCSSQPAKAPPVVPMNDETRQFAQDMLPLTIPQRHAYIQSHAAEYKHITSDPGQALALRTALSGGAHP